MKPGQLGRRTSQQDSDELGKMHGIMQNELLFKMLNTLLLK